MLSIEKETYINFNDAEPNATLCTYNAAWLRKMDDLSRETKEFTCTKRIDGYGKYSFPKKLVSVRKPVKRPEISAERRNQLSEQMRALHRAKSDCERCGIRFDGYWIKPDDPAVMPELTEAQKAYLDECRTYLPTDEESRKVHSASWKIWKGSKV